MVLDLCCTLIREEVISLTSEERQQRRRRRSAVKLHSFPKAEQPNPKPLAYFFLMDPLLRCTRWAAAGKQWWLLQTCDVKKKKQWGHLAPSFPARNGRLWSLVTRFISFSNNFPQFLLRLCELQLDDEEGKEICDEVRPPPLFILATPQSSFHYGDAVIYIWMCNRFASQRSPLADRPEHVSSVEHHVELGALQLCGSLGHLSRLGQAGLLQQELTWGHSNAERDK